MAITLPGTPDDLGDALRRLPGRLYAVLDGAGYENLPARLRRVGLDPVPLYADEVDLPDLRYGPHLVVCDTGFALEQVRDVQAGSATVVWWCWPGNHAVATQRLVAHLRRLALIDVPAQRPGAAVATPRQGQQLTESGEEPVLFRHADPDVVAALLPVLDPDQRAHFFGGASAVLTETAEGRLVLETAPDPEELHGQVFGRLALSAAQYEALSTVYRAALRRRAVHEFGPYLRSLSRPARRARLLEAFERAETYDLDSKAQLWDFLLLDCRHGPGFELHPGREDVRRELSRDDLPPVERVWRAELALQASRGEADTPVSGTRRWTEPR